MTSSVQPLEFFDQHVRTSPDRLCLWSEDGELTYAGLSWRLDQLAEALTGLRPGEIVAVSAPRSAAGVALALSVWRAGAAFLLLDPDQPQARRNELIADSGARIVLSPDGAEVRHARPAQSTVDDLAYVCYTSGSTGRPNGVLGRYRGLAVITETIRDQFGITAADRIALLAPYHVEGALFEILAAVTTGASLHIPADWQRRPGTDLAEFLRKREITVMVATPTRLRDLDPAEFPALRLVISAGEELPPELARRWAADHLLLNSYGVTEATIASTLTEIPPDVTRVPIGRPLVHCGIQVLDERQRQVADGTVGELYLSGPGLTAGYLNRPELTESRFAEVDGERMYRTGDFAVRDPSGQLYFRGRRDDQVQLGGFRVELGEVRSVLRAHPEVRECAVVLSGQKLAAYVVGADSTPDSALRDWVADHLPRHAVPVLYPRLAELPQTAWGKVDYQALPDPLPRLGSGATRQLTRVQGILADIAGDLLGLRLDGRHLREDLFLLGLSSMLVAQFLGHIEGRFGVRLNPLDIFEHPTLGELAAVLERPGA